MNLSKIITNYLSIFTISSFTLLNSQLINNNKYQIFRVQNGDFAKDNEFPNFVSFKKSKFTGDVTHGATLISPQWVLTSGHNAQKYLKTGILPTAFVGGYDLNNLSKTASNIIKSEKIIVHPQFSLDNPSKSVDVGLIKLSKPVTNVKPMRLLTSQEQLNLNKEATIIGFGFSGLNTKQEPIFPRKLKKAIISLAKNKIAPYEQEAWYKKNFNFDTDFIAGTTKNLGRGAGPGDSGGPLIQTIDNEQVLIGTVKGGGTCASANWKYSPGIYVNVSKVFDWIVSNTQEKTTNEILNYYHHTSYKDIFQDKLNPQEVYSMNDAKITYDWKGSYGSPTWGKLRYRFDGSYAFLIYMYIRQNEKFISYIKNWVQKGQLTNSMKMEVLNHLVFKTLFVNFNDIRSLYWFKDVVKHFSGFINHFFEYFDLKKNRYHKVIKSSLFYKILYTGKTKDALWINEYLKEDSKNEPESWNLGNNRAYDAGLNFFIDFHSKNPGILADILLKGSTWSYPVSARDKNDPFRRPKEIISERTSGASNYLSWIDYNNNNPVKRFHRPGENVYVRDEL